MSEAIPSTRISEYRIRSGMTFGALAAHLGVKRQTAEKYCAHPGTAKHRRPGALPSDRLRALTFGMIHAGNYADELTAAEAAEMMAEIARREAAKAGEVARG